MLFAGVTRPGPIIESIRALGASHIKRQRIRAGNVRIFTRIHVEVAAAACGLAFSFTHGEVRGLAVGIDVEAVFTGALHRKREVRRVDFEGIAAVKSSNVDAQRTLRELNLHGAVVNVQKRNSGFTRETDLCAANVQLATRIPVGPEIVTGREGPVGIRLHPIGLATRLKRHRTLHVIQPRNPPRRVVVGKRRLRESGKKTDSQNQEQEKGSMFSHCELSLLHSRFQGLARHSNFTLTQEALPVTSVFVFNTAYTPSRTFL